MLDRFNVATVALDHTRSLTKYGSSKPDWAAKTVLYLLPLAAGGASVWLQYRLTSPAALVPATGLLAGTFFASVGQLISIRARVADSVQLAGNIRLRAHFRESVSGMLLAALSALAVSLLLSALILLPPTKTGDRATQADDIVRWLAIAATGLALALLTFMCLLFVSSARRLYASYLEAFEKGLPLPRRPRNQAPSTQRDDEDDPDDDQAADAIDLRAPGSNPRP